MPQSRKEYTVSERHYVALAYTLGDDNVTRDDLTPCSITTARGPGPLTPASVTIWRRQSFLGMF